MSTVTIQSASWRTFAGIFDIPLDGPPETGQGAHSPEAIGGSYSMEWSEYFKDAKTGEIYKVRCSDGVYGGHDSYSSQDEQIRSNCYDALAVRFQNSAKEGKTEIRISRNERVVMHGYTHAYHLESADGAMDGRQSKDGLEGGLVGHFHGIPVICDLELPDTLF